MTDTPPVNKITKTRGGLIRAESPCGQVVYAGTEEVALQGLAIMLGPNETGHTHTNSNYQL
jgi:hypothetical protein